MNYKYDKPLSEMIIKDIIKKHFPDQKISILNEITNSFVNSVYSFKLGSERNFILKFNNPRWPKKQQREIESMMKAKLETTIPIPEIVAISSPGDSYMYMIQEKAPGVELRQAIRSNKLSSDEINSIIKTIGSYLGELHKIKFAFFGDFSSVYSEVDRTLNYIWGNRFDNWSDCFTAFCFDILHWVDRDSFPNYHSKLEKKILEYVQLIPDTQDACFVHSDFQPSNIIVDNGRVSAIIDFEWSFAGSASFDFHMTRAGFHFSEFPTFSESNIYTKYSDLTFDIIDKLFTEGYMSTNNQKLKSYPKDFLDFIWLLYMVGSWSWTTQSSSEVEISKFKDDIQNLYTKLFD